MVYTMLRRGRRRACNSSSVRRICFRIEKAHNNILIVAFCTDPPLAQYFTEAIFDVLTVPESEDCLYLNVYAPSSAPPQSGRAVMIWIYGGEWDIHVHIPAARRYAKTFSQVPFNSVLLDRLPTTVPHSPLTKTSLSCRPTTAPTVGLSVWKTSKQHQN